MKINLWLFQREKNVKKQHLIPKRGISRNYIVLLKDWGRMPGRRHEILRE